MYNHTKSPASYISRTAEKSEIVELYTGNLGEREMLKNYTLYGGAGGLTIYAAKPEYISLVEKKFEVTI